REGVRTGTDHKDSARAVLRQLTFYAGGFSGVERHYLVGRKHCIRHARNFFLADVNVAREKELRILPVAELHDSLDAVPGLEVPRRARVAEAVEGDPVVLPGVGNLAQLADRLKPLARRSLVARCAPEVWEDAIVWRVAWQRIETAAHHLGNRLRL